MLDRDERLFDDESSEPEGEREVDDSERAVLGLLRTISNGEEHIEEMRKRLYLVRGADPGRCFSAIRQDCNIQFNLRREDTITATELRWWLSESCGYPVRCLGKDIEALIRRYNAEGRCDPWGEQILDFKSFIDIVAPRAWVSTRDGPKVGMNVTLNEVTYRQRLSEAKIRCAQLIERELELIREVLRREKDLIEIHGLECVQIDVMLGVDKRGFNQASLRHSLGKNLTTDQHRLIVRHLQLSSRETVSLQEWHKFMSMHEFFTAPVKREFMTFTRWCQRCGSSVQRPFVSCPECENPIAGPLTDKKAILRREMMTMTRDQSLFR